MFVSINQQCIESQESGGRRELLKPMGGLLSRIFFGRAECLRVGKGVWIWE